MVCRWPIYLLLAVLYMTYIATGNTNLVITTDKAANIISDKFLSVAIDTGQIRHNWGKLNFSSPKVKVLAKALSPCYLRVGGTEADFMQFSVNSKNVKNYSQSYNISDDIFVNFTMSSKQWDEVNLFAAEVGWSLVFDLNSVLRKNGNWSPVNAELLMNYTTAKGYNVAGWELGNEPNAYKHKLGYRISASQRAKDYSELHNILNKYQQWKQCVIIGPSTTQPKKKAAVEYFQEFLEAGGSDIVTNPTFHHYYVDGRETSVDQFMDPVILDDLPPQIRTVNNIAKHPPYGRSWLGETGSAYGGGAPGLSDRYVAGFMWLDTLGVSALQGLSVVVRQSFYGGHYSLIDDKTLDPNPDFWLSYLYTTLVGQTVLNVTVKDTAGYVRMYAHCSNFKRSKYSQGSITVYGMNLKDESITVSFPQYGDNVVLHVYMLKPVGEDALKSKYVALNGRMLKLNANFTLPDILTPSVQTGNVIFPSHSFGFIVIPNAEASACQKDTVEHLKKQNVGRLLQSLQTD